MKIPPEVTLEREKRAWELRQRCWTQQKIADELNISQSAVSQILNRLCTRYHEENLHDIEQTKIEMINQLELIAYEAFHAWEETKFTKYRSARYLDTVMKAKEQIRKILGIDLNAKVDSY